MKPTTRRWPTNLYVVRTHHKHGFWTAMLLLCSAKGTGEWHDTGPLVYANN